MSETVYGFVLIAIGIVALVGAALNWRIVSNSGKLLNRLLGDIIARVIYGAVGIVLIALGIGRLVAM